MGRVILGIFLGIGGLILVIVVLGVLAIDHRTGGSSSSGFAMGNDQTEPAISVNALKLWSDYQANEVAADNLYKGKRLIVQGQVASISKDFTDGVYLQFSTFNEFEPVHAYLNNEYEQKAAGLQIGQIITVDCKGGGMIIGSPVLRECSIQPEAPEPTVQSTSEPPAQAEAEAQPEVQAQPTAEAVNSQATPTSPSQLVATSPAVTAVTPPVLTYQAPVVYPDEARNQKVQGVVTVVLLVDENGNPQNVTVAHSMGAELDEAAIDAVKQYKFRPAVDQSNGKNVPAQISVNVQFRLY